jgi:hypothetical protein
MKGKRLGQKLLLQVPSGNNMNRHRVSKLLLSAVICFRGLLLAQSVPFGQREDALTIKSPLPLREAIQIISDRYETAVFFEGPKWQWSEDFVVGNMIVREMPSLTLPGGLYPEQTPSVESAVRQLLDAHRSQKGDGPDFRLEVFDGRLHIVPSRIHNAEGVMVPATSILDVLVTVSSEERMASEHLKSICEAVSRATGVKLLRGTPHLSGIDPIFAANGIIAPRDAISRPPEERKPYSFVWGFPGGNARDAIVSLLEQSATTLRYSMGCGPTAMGHPRPCVVNLIALRERVKMEDGKLRPGKGWVFFDRAPQPPVPPPPRKPPE